MASVGLVCLLSALAALFSRPDTTLSELQLQQYNMYLPRKSQQQMQQIDVANIIPGAQDSAKAQQKWYCVYCMLKSQIRA
jgi:hypothetical protein